MSIVGGRLVTDKTPRTETFSPHLIFMLAVTMAGAAALPENVAAAHKYELSMYVRESVVQGGFYQLNDSSLDAAPGLAAQD